MSDPLRVLLSVISGVIGIALVITALAAPVILSIGNIRGLIVPGMKHKRLFWWLTVLLGLFFSGVFLSFLEDVTDAYWDVQLVNSEVHQILNSQTRGIYIALMLIGAAGFVVLATRKMENTPPLVSVLAIAAMYPAAISCVIWCLHIWPLDHRDEFTFPLMVLPINLIIMMCSLIREKIIEWNDISAKQLTDGGIENAGEVRHKGFLGKAQNWPLVALLLMLPLLGIVLGVSVLLGQRPDALIATWTETADWNLSQMMPPPNVMVDEHYLCTVAAGGHEKVVKPLRMGERHGHRVVVNRQLEIANAFELVLEWKTPRLHRVIRGFYDKYGFPIARCIRTKTACDVVFILMKPLEWIFVTVLYLTLAHPENVIAVQYLPGYRDILDRTERKKIISC